MPKDAIKATVFLVGTIALGITSRKFPIGYHLYDKSLGDVLYAVAAYLAVVLVTRWPISRAAAVSLAGCYLIEGFKLTGIPLTYRAIPLVPWLLGSRFSVHNLVCYPIGVATIAVMDKYIVLRDHNHDPSGQGRLVRRQTQMERVMLSRTGRVTVAEVETLEQPNGRAFGDLHDDWRAFVDGISQADELWRFRSSEETWGAKSPHGLMGYVIVRDGHPREVFFTKVQ